MSLPKLFLTNDDIVCRCAEIANDLPEGKTFYGVPRGGIAPAYSISAMTSGYITDDPADADYIVDDLIDSGKTRDWYISKYPDAQFVFLYDHSETKEEWLVFPWEVARHGNDESATDIFVRLLELVGEDPSREGLVETPKRMEKMYAEITSGYKENPADYFKTFSENADSYDEMIILDPIPFYSICEHHMVPFMGDVTIGYIPDKRFAGLSKFARAVGTFARRLQIQERMTHQIAECIEKYVQPKGVAVIIRARHLCMEMRGVKTHGVFTTTSALKGVMMTDTKARNEFLHLTRR